MGKQLLVRCGGKELTLSRGQSAVIGRDRSADLSLNNSAVSRRHAKISYQNGRFTLTDLNSTNGLYVAGQRLHPGRAYEMEGVGQVSLGKQPSAPTISYQEKVVNQQLKAAGSPATPVSASPALPPRAAAPKGVEKIPASQPIKIPRSAVSSASPNMLSRSDMLVPTGWTTLGIAKKPPRPAPARLPANLGKTDNREIVGAGNQIPIPAPGQVFHIGRDPENEVVLPDPMVSSRHAVLAINYGRLTVTDLGSTNGVFINGLRVRAAQIQPGDVLTVGRISLRLVGNNLVRIGPIVAEGQRHDALIGTIFNYR